MAHENTCVITDFFESDGVAVERHLMATGIVVEPVVADGRASAD